MTDPSNPVDSTLASEATAKPAAPAKSRRGLFIGIGVAAVLVIGAAIAIPVSIANAEAAAAEAAQLAADQAERDRLAIFPLAMNECGLKESVDVGVLDGGEALSLQRVGKWTGPAIADLYCVLGELDAPSTIEAKIGATRALDGVQDDDWTGFKIEWRYHPDDGATVLVEQAQ